MKFLFTISVVSSKLVDEKKENHQLRVSFPLFVLRASRVGEHANARENYRTRRRDARGGGIRARSKPRPLD